MNAPIGQGCGRGGCRLLLRTRCRSLFDRREEKLVDFALRRWHVSGADPEGETEVKIDSLENGPGSTFEIVP